MNTMLIFCITAFCTLWASAQPQPLVVTDGEVLRRVDIWSPQVGATVWSVPGPYELVWYIVYDSTPLTVDAVGFEIRLVNTGRPVRAPRGDRESPIEVTLVLTCPDGALKVSETFDGSGFIYNSGKSGVRIDRGKPVAQLRVELSEYFGELEPGKYELQINMDAPEQLLRARDGHVIADRLKLSLPLLRFEVVDHPVSEHSSEGHNMISIIQNAESAEAQELSNTLRGVLVNTLGVPISLWVDRGWDPDWAATVESPAFVYNGIERWTDIGWVRDGGVGYCGTGRGKVTLASGESLPIVLSLPMPGANSPGVYRCVVTAQKADGESVEFSTKPIVIPYYSK